MEVEGSNVDLENFEKSQPWEPSLKVNTPHHRNRNFLPKSLDPARAHHASCVATSALRLRPLSTACSLGMS
jgi:hypothetical protein